MICSNTYHESDVARDDPAVDRPPPPGGPEDYVLTTEALVRLGIRGADDPADFSDLPPEFREGDVTSDEEEQRLLDRLRKAVLEEAPAQTPKPKAPRKAQSQRFRVSPRDVPLEAAARRLGLSEQEFIARLPNLIARGFPAADPDTGHFDMNAIDRWCDSRHSHLFGGASVMQARDASTVAKERIEKMKAGGGGRG